VFRWLKKLQNDKKTAKTIQKQQKNDRNYSNQAYPIDGNLQKNVTN
jgi:hypothetical protein